MEAQEFKSELKRLAEKVTEYIVAQLDKGPKILYDASLHLIRSGGKRLRPFIVVKFYNLYKDGEDSILPAAAALELVHNFTLIHDDIMDRDKERHGVKTVHLVYGDAIAILAGDLLFAKAFELLSESEALDDSKFRKAAKLLSAASVELCEGQSDDVTSIKRDFDREFYFSLINKKTSSLLSAASSIGCLAGGGTDEEIREASLYGRKLGLAFQIVDDLLGIVGDPKVTGKPVGGDLREGKKTLPIFLALQRASENEKRIIKSVHGKRNADQKDIEKAVEIIRGLRVEEDIRKEAERYAKEALWHLYRLPDGPGRPWLVHLVNFVVKRAH